MATNLKENLICVEKNIGFASIFKLTKEVDEEKVVRIELFTDDDKIIVEAEKGLPSAKDYDVLLAAFTLAARQNSKTARFKIAEIKKITKYKGNITTQVKNSFKKCLKTQLEFINSFYDGRKKQKITYITHLISEFVYETNCRGALSKNAYHTVTFSDKIFDNLLFYRHLVDGNIYFSLPAGGPRKFYNYLELQRANLGDNYVLTVNQISQHLRLTNRSDKCVTLINSYMRKINKLVTLDCNYIKKDKSFEIKFYHNFKRELVEKDKEQSYWEKICEYYGSTFLKTNNITEDVVIKISKLKKLQEMIDFESFKIKLWQLYFDKMLFQYTGSKRNIKSPMRLFLKYVNENEHDIELDRYRYLDHRIEEQRKKTKREQELKRREKETIQLEMKEEERRRKVEGFIDGLMGTDVARYNQLFKIFSKDDVERIEKETEDIGAARDVIRGLMTSRIKREVHQKIYDFLTPTM